MCSALFLVWETRNTPSEFLSEIRGLLDVLPGIDCEERDVKQGIHLMKPPRLDKARCPCKRKGLEKYIAGSFKRSTIRTNVAGKSKKFD